MEGTAGFHSEKSIVSLPFLGNRLKMVLAIFLNMVLE